MNYKIVKHIHIYLDACYMFERSTTNYLTSTYLSERKCSTNNICAHKNTHTARWKCEKFKPNKHFPYMLQDRVYI